MINHLKKDRFINIALFLIVLLALFLRTYKISHHLHGGFVFEESSYIKMILTGDSSPVKRFNYPPFFMLWLSIINKVYFFFGLLVGRFKNFTDLVNAFNIDYSLDFYRLLLTHRMITAIIGTLTIPTLFFIAKNLFNRTAGLISALFLAVSPLHVYTSMDAVGPDNLQMFFLCLVYLYICKIFKENPLRQHYILAGLFLGLAAATKYFGILCILPLILGHFFIKKDKRNNKSILISLAIALGVIFITCFPLMIANLKDVNNTANFFVENYSKPVSKYNTIYQPLAQKIGWLSCPASLAHGLGAGVAILSGLGFLFSLIRHNKIDVMILIFPIIYYLSLGNFYDCQTEYFLPLIPFMILLAVSFLVFISQITYLNNKRNLIQYVVACFIAFSPLRETIYFTNWISQKSIEEDTKNWILKNIPHGSSVLFDGDDMGETGKLQPFLFYARRIPYKVTVLDWKKDFNPDHFFKENQFNYVIIDMTRYVPARLRLTYEYIDRNFNLIKEFNPKFPTPRSNFFSIYGIFYNHSFGIYKNNKIDT